MNQTPDNKGETNLGDKPDSKRIIDFSYFDEGNIVISRICEHLIIIRMKKDSEESSFLCKKKIDNITWSKFTKLLKDDL
jgi:hypothetical protein